MGWWNVFLESTVAKLLLLPLGYGVFRFAEYLLKRLIEGKPQDESIDRYSKLADLQKKMDEGGMTIPDLDRLRAAILGDSAEEAVVLATRYTGIARRLVNDAWLIEEQSQTDTVNDADPRWNTALTQYDMNMLSATKVAEAEEELARVVDDILADLPDADAALLRQSQEKWRAFVRTEAERQSSAAGAGTIRPLHVNGKVEAMIRERIASLRFDADGEGGPVLEQVRTRTPLNLFEHIEPQVPKQRVLDLLGTPSYVSGNVYIYRFAETQVQVTFNDDACIANVVVGLRAGESYSGIGVVTDIPLGKLTLGDLLAIDPQISFEYRSSMRTQELLIWTRVGPPGAWTAYCFGALSVFSGAGNLRASDFVWDQEAERLVTDPNEVVINWVGVSDNSIEAPYLYWYIK